MWLFPAVPGKELLKTFISIISGVFVDFDVTSKNTTVFKLIKVPAVCITGMVVVIVSSTWSFLDPTLEPHLRQVKCFFKLFSKFDYLRF